MLTSRQATIYLVPFKGYPHGRAFFKREPLWENLRQALKKRGINIRCRPLSWIPKGAGQILLLNWWPSKKTIERLKGFGKGRLTLFVWEPPVVLPLCHNKEGLDLFGTVYTLRDDQVDGERFHKFQFPHDLNCRAQPLPFKEKKLLTIITRNRSSARAGELYSERRRAIDFFEQYPDDFTLYGRDWEWEGLQSYGGPVSDKYSTLARFRFALTYENQLGMPGWISEKIVDCLRGRSVPIYLGAPNLDSYIPRDCYIDRSDFADHEALLAYLKGITEEEHEGYLARAEDFLNSPAAYPFSEEAFIKTITLHLEGGRAAPVEEALGQPAL